VKEAWLRRGRESETWQPGDEAEHESKVPCEFSIGLERIISQGVRDGVVHSVPVVWYVYCPMLLGPAGWLAGRRVGGQLGVGWRLWE
jgi:hypothetical protein